MELYQLTITQAIDYLKRKKCTSVELTQSLLQRVYKLDKKIKAFVSVFSDRALEQAKEADKLLGKSNIDIPLLGIPFVIKDNICMKGTKTTASANVLKDYIAVYDGTVVERLESQNAVILGKTNMDAWAHGSSTEASDFFTTHNPWNLERLPGGSSGGSAASVIADMTIGGIGTETAGSIRQPAAWCGVVGLKPTYGRVSRYGIISMGSSLDSPGPITKTVEDAALVLEIIAGHDPFDATSAKRNVESYRNNLTGKVKGLKIGIARKYIEISDSSVQKSVDEAIKVFEKIGVKIKEVELLDPQYAISVYTILQRAEVSANLARYDGIRYGYGRELFGEEAKRRIMLGTYALSTGYYDALYVKAQQIRTMIIEDFDRVFNQVDVIIGPTSPCIALKLGATKDNPMFGEVQDVLVEPSTIAGLPGISLVCGFAEDLPVGLQIIGPQFSESIILNSAYAYERETEWHKKRPILNI